MIIINASYSQNFLCVNDHILHIIIKLWHDHATITLKNYINNNNHSLEEVYFNEETILGLGLISNYYISSYWLMCII